MQLKFTKEADFRQERDFGAKIGATFEFLAAHWKPLGKCLLYFVLPVALLMGLAMGIAQNQQLSFTKGPTSLESIDQFNRFSTIFTPFYWLGIVISIITYALLAATVHSYIRLRLELPATQEVTPRLVGEQLTRLAPRLLLSNFVIVLLVAIGLVLLFIPGVYLAVGLSLVWAVQGMEDTSLRKAISRSLYLIKGNWWATLGLTLVMSIILGLIAVVFQIPQYVAIIGKTMHWQFLASDALMVASAMLASSGQMLLYSALFVALSFQYFNLVERKEGVGLRSMVDSLGHGPAPVAHNQAYRPDNEGEY